MKSYNELVQLQSYEERLKYLRLYSSNPSNKNRAFMNKFYKSEAWLRVREAVIRRDIGCDLGVQNLFVEDETMIVHHINPITEEDIANKSELLLSMNNLITVSSSTHNKIHYWNEEEDDLPSERKPGDTTLW